MVIIRQGNQFNPSTDNQGPLYKFDSEIVNIIFPYLHAGPVFPEIQIAENQQKNQQ